MYVGALDGCGVWCGDVSRVVLVVVAGDVKILNQTRVAWRLTTPGPCLPLLWLFLTYTSQGGIDRIDKKRIEMEE